jgi:hypothetical protein
MALDYDKTEYTLTYNEEKQKYRLKYSQADVFAVVIAKSLVEAPVEKVDIRIKNSVLHGMTIYPINEGVELNNVKIYFEDTDNFSGANLLVTPNTDFYVKNNKGACMLYGCEGLILDGACSFSDNLNIKVCANFMRISATTNERLRFSELKVENCKNTSKNSYSSINNFADIVFREASTRNRLNLKNITVDYHSGSIQSPIKGRSIGVDSIAYSNFSIENTNIFSLYGIKIAKALNTDIKSLEMKADTALSCEGVNKSSIDIDGLVMGEKSSLDLLINSEYAQEGATMDIAVKDCALKHNSKLDISTLYGGITLENIDLIDAAAKITAISYQKENGGFMARNIKEFKLKGVYDVRGFGINNCDKFELGLNRPDGYEPINANIGAQNCKSVVLKANSKVGRSIKGNLDLLAVKAEVFAKNIEFGGWNSTLYCECVGKKIQANKVTLNNANLSIKGGSEVSDLVASYINKITVTDSQVSGLDLLKDDVKCTLDVNIEQSIVKNVNVAITDTQKSGSDKISIIGSELSDSEIRGSAKLVDSIISGAVTGSTFEVESTSYFGRKDVVVEGAYINQELDEPKQVKPVEVVKSDKKINDVEL